MTDWMETYETSQPWVIYRYGLTHDKWWPFWNSTRFLGRARIICTCAVCGDRTVLTIKMPRTGPVPDVGKHPKRVQYLAEHAHPDICSRMSWVAPMTNVVAYSVHGIDGREIACAMVEADGMIE